MFELYFKLVSAMGSILSALSSKPNQITNSHQNRTIIRGDRNIGGSNFNIKFNSKNSLLVIAIVGALIPYGIYEYVRKTPQPGTEPGTEPGTAETVNTFNVNSILGWITNNSNTKR
jgi:hypothetical protein